MKIRAIHTCEAGPLRSQTFDFKDDWSGEIITNILRLLSGHRYQVCSWVPPTVFFAREGRHG